VVKACTNKNKKETRYCRNTIFGLDIDCCDQSMAPYDLEIWDAGDMDVHGTALILKDGSVSSIPAMSDGKHVLCSAIGTLRLNVDR
jgi:hypothetical protein